MKVVQVHDKCWREGKVSQFFHSLGTKSPSDYQSAKILKVSWVGSWKEKDLKMNLLYS